MKSISRRNFTKKSALAAGIIAVLPDLRAYSPNRKLNLAFIGVGGRSGANLRGCDIHTADGVATNNIVALCDVSDERAAAGYKKYPKAKRYTDFRKMFDEMANEIDAVVISTPDHTHFAATMAAMQLGKHVYVEKPLAHNVWQLRTLKKAAKHYGVVTQMGNQGHTTAGVRRVKEWVDNGIVGDVKEVFAWSGGPHFKETGYFLKPTEYPAKGEAIPEGIDWDSWLGPNAERPYSPYYLPRFWRSWYEFGHGQLGDWACHTLDAPFWSLDLGMPTSTTSIARNPQPQNHHFVSDQSVVRFEFPARGSKPPVTMHWFEGGLTPTNRPEWNLDSLPNGGMIMVGSKRSIMTGGRPDDSRLMVSKEEAKEIEKSLESSMIPRVKENDPQGEWIRAIKEEGPKCGSPFSYAADLTEMAVIGVLAQRFHTHIEYDAANMKVTNHKDFDQYLKEPVRKGWEYGEELWSGGKSR